MSDRHLVSVVLAKPPDMGDIRKVTRQSWVETYVNSSKGIYKEDIDSKFLLDYTKEGKKLAKDRLKNFFNKKTRVFVAKVDDNIVGYCVAVKDKGKNRIQAIYILKKFQGIGIGKKLLTQCLDWLGNDDEIHINVADYNTNAIHFYEHFGFYKVNDGKVVKLHALPTGTKIGEIEMVKK